MNTEERRAKDAEARGRFMGNGGAGYKWRTYFSAACYYAKGSDAFLPHAVYGLQNMLYYLVQHAENGKTELAESIKLLSTLESPKVNHGKKT